jgi:3-deoxy-D-manno-octulosonic-acid transferase
VVVSVTTNPGYEVALRNFKGRAVIVYSPLDLSFVIRRFFNIIRPKIFIVVETEIWPNLIRFMKARGVPVVVINGRISDRSFKRYMMARPLLKTTLRKIDLFCMQSGPDAERIVRIGAPQDKIRVTGNMKFDIVIVSGDRPEIKKGLLGLSEKDILLVAGSTHKGEEKVLLEAYRDLIKDFNNLKLLIAPRHINRALEIKKLINSTQGVFVLDTVGQLKYFYSIADIVFIGGSLVPHGGQNPIEPAYFSKPIIFGPNMSNFKYISEILLKNAAAVEVNDKDGLKKAVSLLINDPKKSRAMGFFAKKSLEENKGATLRNVELLKGFFTRR